MIEEISPDGHRTAGQVTHYLRYAAAANDFVGSHGRVSPSSQTCGMSISSHNPVHRPTLGKTETENTSGTKSEGAAQKAVFLASLQGEFTSGNAAFSQFLGYSAKELEGRKLSALFTPTEKNIREGGADFQKALLNAGAGQEDYQAQLFVRAKSGESILVEVSATLVRDSQATPVAIVGIVTPVAEATAAPGKSVAAAAVALGPGITSRTIDDTQFILASPVMHKFMGLVERVAGHTETVLVTGETAPGWTSTVRRFRKIWSRANYLATKKARSAAPTAPSPVFLNLRTKARCSLTKSASCNCRRKASCCVCWTVSPSTA